MKAKVMVFFAGLSIACTVHAMSTGAGTPVGPMSAQYFADENFSCDTIPAGTTLVRDQADKINGINSSGVITREYHIEKIQMEPQVVVSGYGLIISRGPVADTGCGGSLKWTLTIQDSNGTGKSPAVLHLDRVDQCPGSVPQKQSSDFQLSCALK